MQKPSRKHHYLPRKYLRGFTDPRGGFFVYDKRADRVFPSSPDAAFFENHLNTVVLPDGSSSDFLERLYTQMEGQSWSSLDAIRDSGPHGAVALLDKMNLFLFLSFLHWRLPSNAAAAETLSQDFFGTNERLNFFRIRSKDGGSPDPESIARIRTSEAWKKSAKMVIPFAPLLQGESWMKDVEGWRFLYTGDNQRWFIVGDNPLVARDQNHHDPLNCLKEFLFPVSGNILLISYAKPLHQVLPSEFAPAFGVAIVERAERFVACHDEQFLTALVKLHHADVAAGRSDRSDNLFDMIGNG
jgi:hypothetical protein